MMSTFSVKLPRPFSREARLGRSIKNIDFLKHFNFSLPLSIYGWPFFATAHHVPYNQYIGELAHQVTFTMSFTMSFTINTCMCGLALQVTHNLG